MRDSLVGASLAKAPAWVRVMDLSSLFLYMGQQTPIISIFALLYWFLNRQGAGRLLFLLLFSMIVNAALKSLFKVPLKSHMADQNWYAFPSGHMQMCIVFYGYVGWLIRHKIKWIWALLPLTGLYGWALIDQNYHDFSDVVAGAVVGAVMLALFLWVETIDWVQEKWRLMGVLLLPFTVLLLFYITGAVDQKVAHAWQAQGGLLGLSMGLLLCGGRFFSLSFPLIVKAIHAAVGLLGFCALWVFNVRVLKGLGHPFFPLLSFFLLGAWLGGAADYCANKMTVLFYRRRSS